MKKIILLLTVIAATFSVQAQKQKNTWKEMLDFHAIMSKTFHPAEEGKFQPLKDSASILVQKAETWQKSVAPEGYNKDATSPILKNLVAKCKEVEAAVKAKKSDEDLKKLITEAHEIFHEIAEKCRKGDEHEHN